MQIAAQRGKYSTYYTVKISETPDKLRFEIDSCTKLKTNVNKKVTNEVIDSSTNLWKITQLIQKKLKLQKN